MSALKSAVKKVVAPRLQSRAVDKALRDGVPRELEDALRFLATGERSARVTADADRVEAVRAKLAARPGNVPVLYSPKPNSAGEDTSIEARPEIGEQMEFTHERIANQTSTQPKWGSFLQLCAEASGAQTIVELGSCAGIASCYLSSAQQAPKVITIEGSAGLAAIARDTTSEISDRTTVIHGLFDDALDELLPSLEESGVGLVWIDGHHERVATIHYFRRMIPTLKPGSYVLFDDTSWSQDMRECWNTVAAWPGFAHTLDLGKFGIGIWQGGDVQPKQWDLRGVTGYRAVGNPHGWQ